MGCGEILKNIEEKNITLKGRVGRKDVRCHKTDESLAEKMLDVTCQVSHWEKRLSGPMKVVQEWLHM